MNHLLTAVIILLTGSSVYCQNLAVSKQPNGEYVLTDAKGKTTILSGYNEVSKFSNGLVAVRYEGKWRFIDNTGKTVLTGKYDDVQFFTDVLVKIKIKNKYGIVDNTGKLVLSDDYDNVFVLTNELIKIKSKSKYGVVDNTGKTVLTDKYDNVEMFSDQLIKVKLKGKYGIVDKSGREMVRPSYGYIYPLSDGMAIFQLNGKYGFLDKSTREVIPATYENAGDFSEGLAAIRLNGKWGFINKEGAVIIPPKYLEGDYIQMPGPFTNGYSLILNESYFQYKESSFGGDEYGIYPRECKEFLLVDTIGRENRFSVLDYKLSINVGPQYKKIYSSAKYKRVLSKHKMGIVDRRYKFVTPVIYDTIYPIQSYPEIAVAKNVNSHAHIYIDLKTGATYKWNIGKTEATYNLSDRQIIKFNHQFEEGYPSYYGLKTPDEQILLYPVVSDLSIDGNKLTASLSPTNGELTKVTIDISELGQNKIKFSVPLECWRCAGDGIELDFDGMAAARRQYRTPGKTETTTRYETTWEKVWNTKTNSYDDVKGTRLITTTTKAAPKTTSTLGDTMENKYKRCGYCGGKGSFTGMIWNLEQLDYSLY